jgi:hypothetical protein
VRAGERVTAYDGDTLKFGSVMLTLTLPGGEARSAPPAPAAAAAEPEAAPVDRGEPVGMLVNAEGVEFPLYEGVNTLGRRSGNQIVLPDAFASGQHAEIACQADGTTVLTDLGSTNGSFLAGERLAPQTPVTLTEGAELTLGKTKLTFRTLASAAAEEPAAADAAEPEREQQLDEPAAGADPADD